MVTRKMRREKPEDHLLITFRLKPPTSGDRRLVLDLEPAPAFALTRFLHVNRYPLRSKTPWSRFSATDATKPSQTTGSRPGRKVVLL
jgi:hypothetical protein